MVSYKALNTVEEDGLHRINRTFMELKQLLVVILLLKVFRINRTFMELKHRPWYQETA